MYKFRRYLKLTARLLVFPSAFVCVVIWMFSTCLIRQLYDFYHDRKDISFRQFMNLYILNEV